MAGRRIVRWHYRVVRDWSRWIEGDPDEDSLPDHDFDDTPKWWYFGHDADERPEWEVALGLKPCKQCQNDQVLDPLGYCRDCRLRRGRCAWCGLERWHYQRARACKTCYRWLARNRSRYSLTEVEHRLLTNAQARRRRAKFSKARSGA